jgi:hypothetical protein
MSRWSREEIEETFQRHQDLVVEIGKSWEWARYGELFTEDATYVEHLYGKMAGRDKISEWIASTMDTFPVARCPSTRSRGTRSTWRRVGSSAKS